MCDDWDYPMALRLQHKDEKIARLERTIEQIFRDRREPDKIIAYCLSVKPDLVATAATRRSDANADA